MFGDQGEADAGGFGCAGEDFAQVGAGGCAGEVDAQEDEVRVQVYRQFQAFGVGFGGEQVEVGLQVVSEVAD